MGNYSIIYNILNQLEIIIGFLSAHVNTEGLNKKTQLKIQYVRVQRGPTCEKWSLPTTYNKCIPRKVLGSKDTAWDWQHKKIRKIIWKKMKGWKY